MEATTGETPAPSNVEMAEMPVSLTVMMAIQSLGMVALPLVPLNPVGNVLGVPSILLILALNCAVMVRTSGL